MRAIVKGSAAISAIALLASASAVSAQVEAVTQTGENGVLVTGTAPARTGKGQQEREASGGVLGLARDQLGLAQLLNGVPVRVDTVQWNDSLVASEVKLKARDLKTAQMIQSGTQQKFAQQGAKIGENTLAPERNEAATKANAAAAEALRGRFGDIDQYNVRGTTNVYFDTGKFALLLVVGYTDSPGSYEVHQALSEKRAGRVVNHLQQQCGWKPWRMLAPSGFADSDPTADNSTREGRAQNRRVAVNVLVSKSVEGQ